MVAFGGVLVAILMKTGLPPEMAMVFTVLAGALIGMGIGAISGWAQVPSFMVTLGALVSVRGIT
jgi:ribose transport system permease protein